MKEKYWVCLYHHKDVFKIIEIDRTLVIRIMKKKESLLNNLTVVDSQKNILFVEFGKNRVM